MRNSQDQSPTRNPTSGAALGNSQSAIIRAALKSDIEGILAIETSSFQNPGERFHRRQIASLVANPRTIVLVAQDAAGELLGWGAALARKTRRRGDAETRRNAGETAGEPVSLSPPLPLSLSPSAVSGRIYAVAVHPHARGLGAGKKLMVAMMDDLHGRGAKRIFLEVRADNASAIGLYHKLGFVDAGMIDHYYGHQLHALKMVHN